MVLLQKKVGAEADEEGAQRDDEKKKNPIQMKKKCFIFFHSLSLFSVAIYFRSWITENEIWLLE